jgi:hypothetical protein
MLRDEGGGMRDEFVRSGRFFRLSRKAGRLECKRTTYGGFDHRGTEGTENG